MLSVYTLNQAAEWDHIVRSFSIYDTYWLSGYVKAFQIRGEGEPLLFYFENEDVKGINVAMKRDLADCAYFKDTIAPNTIFDLSTPYGYGGWLIEGEKTEELFATYDAWCLSHNIVCEFVRFHPTLKNHDAASNHYHVIPLGETITMDLCSPETIWENITSKNRNVIRKAQKSGVKIYNGRCPAIFEEFREIYNKTMDKDHASSYYYFSKEFYESILTDLPYNAQIFYAVHEEKIVSAAIFLTANGMINYHLSGSRQDFSHLAATNLLLYEVALWGHYNGYKSLYLGGGVGSTEDGLFKFKRAFYRPDDLARFYIGKKIFDQAQYNALVGMRVDLPETEFFPKYRA